MLPSLATATASWVYEVQNLKLKTYLFAIVLRWSILFYQTYDKYLNRYIVISELWKMCKTTPRMSMSDRLSKEFSIYLIWEFVPCNIGSLLFPKKYSRIMHNSRRPSTTSWLPSTLQCQNHHQHNHYAINYYGPEWSFNIW